MDRALSLLISAGTTAFGVWIIGYTMASGSPLGWTLMGILCKIPGSISLYQAVGEARLAWSCFLPARRRRSDRPMT
jgi:hypothetical protein